MSKKEKKGKQYKEEEEKNNHKMDIVLSELLQRAQAIVNNTSMADMSKNIFKLETNVQKLREKADLIMNYIYILIDDFFVHFDKEVNSLLEQKKNLLNDHAFEIKHYINNVKAICQTAESYLHEKNTYIGHFGPMLKTELEGCLEQANEFNSIDYDTFTSIEWDDNMDELLKFTLGNLVAVNKYTNEKEVLRPLFLDTTFQANESANDLVKEINSKTSSDLCRSFSEPVDTSSVNNQINTNLENKIFNSFSSLSLGNNNASQSNANGNKSTNLGYSEIKGIPQEKFLNPVCKPQPRLRYGIRENSFFKNENVSSQRNNLPASPIDTHSDVITGVNGKEYVPKKSDTWSNQQSAQRCDTSQDVRQQNVPCNPTTTADNNLSKPFSRNAMEANANVPGELVSNFDSKSQTIWPVMKFSLGESLGEMRKSGSTCSADTVAETQNIRFKDSSSLSSDQRSTSSHYRESNGLKDMDTHKTTVQSNFLALNEARPFVATRAISPKHRKCVKQNNLNIMPNLVNGEKEASNLFKVIDGQLNKSYEITMPVYNISEAMSPCGNNVLVTMDYYKNVATTIQHKSPVSRCEPLAMNFDLTSLLPLSQANNHENMEIKAKLVNVIDEHGGKGFNHPTGLTVTSEGLLIVADTGHSVVKVLDGHRLLFALGNRDGINFARPSAVVTDTSGHIYVKDDQCIKMFDYRGAYLQTIGKGKLQFPNGLALTKQGEENVLVTIDVHRRSPSIFQYNINQDTLSSYMYESLVQYGSVASKVKYLVTYNNIILASDLGHSCMYLSTLKGRHLQSFGCPGAQPGNFNEPSGVTVDGAGNWIVADSKNNRLQAFSHDGHFLAHIKLSSPIQKPTSIHLTSDGNLFVVNYLSNKIMIFKLH